MDTGARLALLNGVGTNAEVVHRLGAAAVLATALVVVVWAVTADRHDRRARRRVRELFGGEEQPPRKVRFRGRELAGWIPVLGSACGGFVLAGGAPGAVLGGLAGYGGRLWLRRRERVAAQAAAAPGATTPAGAVSPAELAEAERQLPLAADLVAACVTAGAGPVAAAEAVGESLGGPVGDRLARAAVELRLGGEAAHVWGRLGAIPGARPLARCLGRACESGAPAADELGRIAGDCRAEWARTAAARAHRAGVLIAAPVGLCLLPAFLAVGVVPVVIGLAGGVLNAN